MGSPSTRMGAALASDEMDTAGCDVTRFVSEQPATARKRTNESRLRVMSIDTAIVPYWTSDRTELVHLAARAISFRQLKAGTALAMESSNGSLEEGDC